MTDAGHGATMAVYMAVCVCVIGQLACWVAWSSHHDTGSRTDRQASPHRHIETHTETDRHRYTDARTSESTSNVLKYVVKLLA